MDTDTLTLGRIIMRWGLVALELSAVVCIFWAFVGAFTDKKRNKIITVILMVAISILVYMEFHKTPKIIHMKEDVIYIHPKHTENEK
jgi:hypothetical protein